MHASEFKTETLKLAEKVVVTSVADNYPDMSLKSMDGVKQSQKTRKPTIEKIAKLKRLLTDQTDSINPA